MWRLRGGGTDTVPDAACGLMSQANRTALVESDAELAEQLTAAREEAALKAAGKDNTMNQF